MNKDLNTAWNLFNTYIWAEISCSMNLCWIQVLPRFTSFINICWFYSGRITDRPNLSTVLLAQQASNHAYLLTGASAYLSFIIKMQYLQSPWVIYLAKKYQHKNYLSKRQENKTASYWCWRWKCLMVARAIIKMGCCMKRKCHFQLPSFLISVSCVFEWMCGN